MCVQDIGKCSVRRGVFSTLEGYHEYIGGDIMSTSRGYHEYIGGCSVHRGFQYISKAFINLLPHMNHDIPRCTHGIAPMYWTPQLQF